MSLDKDKLVDYYLMFFEFVSARLQLRSERDDEDIFVSRHSAKPHVSCIAVSLGQFA